MQQLQQFRVENKKNNVNQAAHSTSSSQRPLQPFLAGHSVFILYKQNT